MVLRYEFEICHLIKFIHAREKFTLISFLNNGIPRHPINIARNSTTSTSFVFSSFWIFKSFSYVVLWKIRIVCMLKPDTLERNTNIFVVVIVRVRQLSIWNVTSFSGYFWEIQQLVKVQTLDGSTLWHSDIVTDVLQEVFNWVFCVLWFFLN